ncbi:FAD-dependent oxidoreductase [Gulosibacter sp. 10]|uniref:flavin monoamine oxidase family protein n=1 Tax=Gulosibacter sp. 10 TaxID=1255570 RepID=UPI00097F57E6|nr:FAD-dependent oxidoreductase [Gulosibacter sp. 10]SJM58580.1 amine oxidase [Gulosibacter sp. 10]
MPEVIIVGGGPAGLAAAYHLERAGIASLVLEESERHGGRALTRRVHSEPVNLGAMFVYRDTPAERLAKELGVELRPFEPETLGIHTGDRTVVSRDNGALIDALPLPAESKASLAGFFERAAETYYEHTESGRLSAAAAALNEVSAQEQLEGLSEDVREILVAAIRGGSVARPAELSAAYALRYFASYLVHEQHNRAVAAAGIETIPDELARRLEHSTIRTGLSVERVSLLDDGEWLVEGGGERHRARHVVLAVPAPRIPALVELPEWKLDALARIKTPGSTVLGVVADVRNAVHPTVTGRAGDERLGYDDWSFVITPGRPFDAVINPQPHRGSGTAQFVCYGNVSGYVPEANRPGSGVLEAWVEEFLAVAPGLRGRILGAEIKSWEHCFSLLTPERHAALSDIQRPVEGTLHFAGDYSSETAGTHGAYAEGQRVADAIIETFG